MLFIVILITKGLDTIAKWLGLVGKVAWLDMLSGLDRILSMLVTVAIYGTYEENDFCDR